MEIFKVIYYLLIILIVINGFQIDVKRKHYVEVNNIKIDTNCLQDYLEENEKDFLFGNLKQKPEIQFVHVSKRINRNTSRRKRSTANTGKISFQLEGSKSKLDNGEEVNLKLQQSPKLIDDAFILINRYENFSQFISNSHKLAVEYERCFYRNENSALDLCDDTAIRGIFRHKFKDFLIHPLPERFSKNSHIIIEANNNNNGNNNITSKIEKNKLNLLSKNIHFEPEKDEFIEYKKFHTNKSKFSYPYRTTETSFIDYTKFDINNLTSYDYKKQQQQEYYDLKKKRFRRFINSVRSDNRQKLQIPKVLHIETAIFVDKDLLKHMTRNFPKNTESHLIRFVLAMVNGVQLLYHHPSLGHQINFVLKRLEILHSDPKELRRSSDIDIYLNNFCMWQRKLNPSLDSDAVHYDHAVILTGLDLYVIGKNGKVSSQVVGLAPVAGMCTSTSSCTINEGKHFESVFVVAHEIGHNLGMRHDTHENNCDSSLYIMSPTLGSGKITWSKCSRNYLNNFLDTDQSKCLFDRGQFSHSLDHSAEGLLPGERFDADKQCMLKYGKDSIRSRSQVLADICQDLNCQRGRYTWTSHPALEGTECSEMMWCRSGVCVMKATLMESYTADVRQVPNIAKATEKVGFVDKKGGQISRPKIINWNDWSQPTVCESGCLYGETGRLKDGSTGLKTFTRNCLSYKRNCLGKNKKYESCIPKQCYTIKKTTIGEFSTQICERAKKFDSEIIGEGVQIVGETVEDSCKVYCKTKTNGTKSRSWTFPDGTTCQSKIYNFDDKSFCINGRCELFSCDNSTNNYFKLDHTYCPQIIIHEEEESQQLHFQNYQENGRDYKSIRSGQDTIISSGSKENYVDSKLRNNYHQSSVGNFIKRKSDVQQQEWQYIPQSTARLTSENEWIVKSGCHFNCIDNSKGIQIVTSSINRTNNIQLCSPKIKPCDKIQTTTEYAKIICARYKLKVNGLSGYGMQISSSVKDPDRSCRVACQDEHLPARFYLVNGPFGMFPFGTKCSKSTERYCINEKCLEFGNDEIPLTQSYLNLALFRNKRDLNENNISQRRKLFNEVLRQKRSYQNYATVKIVENITQTFIDNIIDSLNFELKNNLDLSTISNDHIEFLNPIYILYDELNQPK